MSDKYDAAALIAEFFKDRKSARQDYLNQPLVEVFDEKTGKMVYKRRSEAVGLPSRESVDYQEKLDSYVEQLDDYYAPQVGDGYELVEGSDLHLHLANKNEESGGVMTQEDYNQAVGYLDNYIETKYASDDGKMSQREKNIHTMVKDKETALLNLNVDSEQIFGDYKAALIKAKIYDSTDDFLNSPLGMEMTEIIKGGDVPDLLELFYVYGYIPHSDEKENDRRIKEAEKAKKNYQAGRSFVISKQSEYLGVPGEDEDEGSELETIETW